MDISALSENNFNAAEWINTHYKLYTQEHAEAAESENSKQALVFINNYVAKLQLYVQQVNFAVEDTSQQLVASMPRIAQEARTLQSDVQNLQQRMQAVRLEVAAVQAETGECMSTLEQLNTLQSKLQLAKESLQESDGWGNLISELEDGFERNDLPGVCEKLLALKKSLQAQQQLAGHAERQSQVEDYKNRLEALASPRVVQAFDEGHVAEAQRFVSMFAGMERLPQLQQYYRAVQKNNLQQQWKQALELHASESAVTQHSTPQQQQQHTHYLTLYYEELLEHSHRQLKWCLQVFGETAQEQPFIVLTELLPTLQPTRDAHLALMLKTCDERLELLQQYAQANHNFARQLDALLQQMGVTLTTKTRQLLGNAIYEYFYKFIQQYARLEETQLSTQIDRLIVSQQSVGEAVRHLENSNRKIFEWLMAACQRCFSITSDLALSRLIALLHGIFKRVLETYAKTQRQLRLSCSSGNAEQWTLLQYSISLLQCLGDFQQRLHKFEQLLHTRMTALAEQLAASSTTELNIYKTIEPVEEQRLLASISNFQQQRATATNTHALALGIFNNVYEALRTYCNETHDIALDILLQPVELQLADIQPPSALHDNNTVPDLPAFSFAPQEYITQIGQYLLTLPQHLEPLLLSPSTLLKQVLEQCNMKYTPGTPCADILLALVVERCCSLYCTQILQIKALTPGAAKQLAVDIEYLSNVTEELGLGLSTHLAQILTLLQAAPEQYLTLSSGCEPRLVTAIRQMRNIISTQ